MSSAIVVCVHMLSVIKLSVLMLSGIKRRLQSICKCQLPVIATRLQHKSRVYFENFISFKIATLSITQQALVLE